MKTPRFKECLRLCKIKLLQNKTKGRKPKSEGGLWGGRVRGKNSVKFSKAQKRKRTHQKEERGSQSPEGKGEKWTQHNVK